MSVFYVSDLDGTLLDRDGRLSDFSRQTLTTLLEEGLPFTVASARSIVSIRQVLSSLPLALPVIGANGAFLSDLQTGNHHLVHDIPAGCARDLLKLIQDHGHAPFLSTYDGEKDKLYYHEIKNAGMESYLKERLESGDPRVTPIEDLGLALSQKVVCFTVIGREGDLRPLERAAQSDHGGLVETHFYEDIYYPTWHWLTLNDRRATKDQAVRTLQDRYGLQGRETVVFGDHSNDIRMFQSADRGIAVGNATPELKKYAQQVIGPNHHDSVVRFIAEDWRKKK